jgi:hypothetical protein
MSSPLSFPIVKSATVTNGPLILTLGSTAALGVIRLIYVALGLTGGASPVTVTLAGLASTDVDASGGANELAFALPPGTILHLPLAFPDFPTDEIIGGSQIAISGSPGTGQTLSVLAIARFN